MDLETTRFPFGFNYDALNKNTDGLTQAELMAQEEPIAGLRRLPAGKPAGQCRDRMVSEILAMLQFHEA